MARLEQRPRSPRHHALHHLIASTAHLATWSEPHIARSVDGLVIRYPRLPKASKNMNVTHTVTGISPMLAVADMNLTLNFYFEILGFSPVMESPEYSIIERDGHSIHFMKATDQSVLDAVRGHTEIYIQVSNISSLWEHVSTFKDRYKIRDLSDRDYGMTEFHIADPNDCLIFIGQPTLHTNATEQGAAANP